MSTETDAQSPDEIVERAIEAVPDDVGAIFESGVLDALRTIRERDPADYARLCKRIKSENRDVSITELKNLTKALGQELRKSKASMLLDLVLAELELFHGSDETCYVSFDKNGHYETWPIGLKGFRGWLSHRFFQESGHAPHEAILTDVIRTLAGMALHEGPEHHIHIRNAPWKKGYLLDLCDEDWRVVNIQPHGWEILDRSPVKFIRTNMMRPLPEPLRGGSIDDLWKHLNIHGDDRYLLLAWILSAMRHGLPTPVLEITGDPGCSKSTTQKMLRELIDSNEVAHRAMPKTPEDLFVAARRNGVVSLDNLSRLPASFQDALCVITTGGGYAGRTLFTNGDESAWDVKRPVMMNGINSLATAGDLVDRVLRIRIQPSQENRFEKEIWDTFNKARNLLLGSILGLFAESLKQLQFVEVDSPPRMADYTQLGESMVRVMGIAGDFTEKYKQSRIRSVYQELDENAIGTALIKYLDQHRQYDGTVKGLYDKLTKDNKKVNDWPRNVRAFSATLQRISPSLKLIGIILKREMDRRADGYHITIEYAHS